MRSATPITVAMLVLMVSLAPLAAAGGAAAPATVQCQTTMDEMAGETTTTDGMGNESMGNETMMADETTMNGSMSNGSMANESMSGTTTHSMDESMNNDSMGNETMMGTETTMDDGMATTTACPDGGMSDGSTTEGMSDGTTEMMNDATSEAAMADETTDGEGGASAFAPGFGVGAAVVALLGAVLLARRRE